MNNTTEQSSPYLRLEEAKRVGAGILGEPRCAPSPAPSDNPLSLSPSHLCGALSFITVPGSTALEMQTPKEVIAAIILVQDEILSQESTFYFVLNLY